MPLPGPDDITTLILDDHETLRRSFAGLDDVRRDVEAGRLGADDLASAWTPIADLLDLHAAAEEKVFYPHLLKAADEDGEETNDAIGDHNKIRDAVARSRQVEVGSEDFWAAVQDAREENDEHMGEEEHEGLASFRLAADQDLRAELGREFTAYKLAHPSGQGMGAQGEDKDPDDFVAEHQEG